MNIEKLKYLTAIIVFVSIIHTSSAASDIDREIARIKSAPPALRVKLMNRLKRKIFRMKREERIRAVRKLRSRIAGGKKGGRGIPSHAKPRNSLHKRVESVAPHTVTGMAHDMDKVPHHPKSVESLIEQNSHATDIAKHIDTPVDIPDKTATGDVVVAPNIPKMKLPDKSVDISEKTASPTLPETKDMVKELPQKSLPTADLHKVEQETLQKGIQISHKVEQETIRHGVDISSSITVQSHSETLTNSQPQAAPVRVDMSSTRGGRD